MKPGSYYYCLDGDEHEAYHRFEKRSMSKRSQLRKLWTGGEDDAEWRKSCPRCSRMASARGTTLSSLTSTTTRAFAIAAASTSRAPC
eukprot:8602270-Lingulodinium_polyedra.AAC.1